MAEIFTTSRHYSCSLICSVHSVTSLGSLPRRQLSCLILFPDSNRRNYESLSEQYSRLAGPDRKTFDDIYQLALGKDSPPYSFLTINVNERPGRFSCCGSATSLFPKIVINRDSKLQVFIVSHVTGEIKQAEARDLNIEKSPAPVPGTWTGNGDAGREF